MAEAAAQWLARRDRGLTTAEQTTFEQWLAADPAHATELDRIEAAWKAGDLAKASPELVAMAVELDRTTAQHAPSWSWRPSFGAAAAAVVLLAGTAWWARMPRTSDLAPAVPSYQVLESAARRITLDDGSVAEVRGDSEVRATFTETERRVTLVQGEAHFTVTKDAARPFIVSAGGASVRAVGTAFNVRIDAGRIEILVTHGKVQVGGAEGAEGASPMAPPLVVAGERAVLEPAAPVAVTSAAPAEIEQALAWQSTRLVFSRTPLGEAVEAFNRHAAAPGVRLTVGDSALLARRLGGTFRATNVEGFVRLLEQSAEVRAERRGDEIVLLPAH